MAVTATPYLYYRIYITKVFDVPEGQGFYAAIDTLSMFETSASTTDLCIGSTATSSSNLSTSSTAAKAIDNNLSTFWESVNDENPKWIKIKFSTAKIVRKIAMICNTYSSEAPEKFIIQGSNDNVNWSDLKSCIRTDRNGSEFLYIYVGGTSLLENGYPSNRVLLHNWNTGTFIASVTPSPTGEWFFILNNNSPLLVTHTGPSGFKPDSDGPVQPMEY